jgi:enamine deaminase RidA (YjgF/YER057c/UK114 family)
LKLPFNGVDLTSALPPANVYPFPALAAEKQGPASCRKAARSPKDRSMPADGPEYLSPPGAIEPTGPWSLGVRAGDFVFVAGMRGIDPATNTLVEGAEARVRQAFLNMRTVVAAAGGGLRDAVRLVVYVTDMGRHRPLVNKIQEELWGGPPYPPRTIVEVRRLNQDDIVEVEGTFHRPQSGRTA